MVDEAWNQVLSISEARTALPSILARFREQGPLAQPVVFGRRREPEAAIVPYALFALLLAEAGADGPRAPQCEPVTFVRGSPRLNEMLSQPGVAEKVAQIRASRPSTRADVLALLRLHGDHETRHDLDSVITELGFSRADLEAELDRDGRV